MRTSGKMLKVSKRHLTIKIKTGVHLYSNNKAIKYLQDLTTKIKSLHKIKSKVTMSSLVKMINFKSTEKEFFRMMTMMTFLAIRKKLNEENKSNDFNSFIN